MSLPDPIIISDFRLIIQLFDLHVQKKALHQRLIVRWLAIGNIVSIPL